MHRIMNLFKCKFGKCAINSHHSHWMRSIKLLHNFCRMSYVVMHATRNTQHTVWSNGQRRNVKHRAHVEYIVVYRILYRRYCTGKWRNEEMNKIIFTNYYDPNHKMTEMNCKVNFKLLIIFIHTFIEYLPFSANAWVNLQFMIKNNEK